MNHANPANPDSERSLRNILESIPEPTIQNEEALYVYQLALATTGTGEIVEIGTNVGKTAIAMATAQKEKGGIPIHTVDIYRHPEFEANLEKAGVKDFVRGIVGESSNVAGDWSAGIELLWLDGDHSFAGTRADLVRWSRHVVPGGHIALHDYPGHLDSTEVWRAIYDTLMRDPHCWRIQADREMRAIVVFERLSYEHPPRSLRRSLTEWIYWRYRDFRHLLFRLLPDFASKSVQTYKNRQLDR